MANVNEEEQVRETYGDAPGVSFDRMTTEKPTPRPKKDAPAESSPAPDAEAAPSAEVVEEAQGQEGEPSTPVTPEPGYNVPPKERWDEVIQARREAERQRDDAMRLAQEALQRVQQPQTQVVQPNDPWEPLIKGAQEPGTAQFWGQVRDLMRHERQLAKQEAVQELAPVIQAGMEKLAQFDLRDFRKENPEIKPGSEEERHIVAYMNGQVDGMRHPLESAKRNVMFDKLKAQVNVQSQKTAAIPQKRQAANAESSSGIPNGAGLPGRSVTGTDRASETLDKGGSVIDAAAAFFGMRR